MKKWTHKDLTDIAVRWLKKPFSQQGPGCHIAVSEMKTGWMGSQTPDAIGWRAHTETLSGTVLVEVKVSRTDFLRDKKKKHHNGEKMGIGNQRFYLAPQGLISPEETGKWGLIEVKPTGGTICTKGYPSISHTTKRKDAFTETLHNADRDIESIMLIRLIKRMGDPEQINRTFKENYRLSSNVEQLEKRIKEYNIAELDEKLQAIRSNSRPLHAQQQRLLNQINNTKITEQGLPRCNNCLERIAINAPITLVTVTHGKVTDENSITPGYSNTEITLCQDCKTILASH